jgi:hypothetical protein
MQRSIMAPRVYSDSSPFGSVFYGVYSTAWHRKSVKIPAMVSPTHSNDSFHFSLQRSELSNFSLTLVCVRA